MTPLELALLAALDDLDPVPIRVLGEGETLHAALVRLLLRSAHALPPFRSGKASKKASPPSTWLTPQSVVPVKR